VRAIGRTIALTFSVVAIVAATLLPGNAIDPGRMPPPWCLACGDLWLTDVVSNVVLFMPLGAALAWKRSTPQMAWLVATALGALLSLTVESLQSMGIPPGRSSAVADILSNSTGTAVGFAVVRYGSQALNAIGLAASRLAGLWAVGVALILSLTSMAVQPRPAWLDRTNVPPVLAPSAFEHVPRFPWFGGVNDSASLNGYRVQRGWSGPIIVTADRDTPQWEGAVTVRGFDPNPRRIPLLFAHVAGDSAPLFMITQHGIDAELVVTRRAADWGLAMPSVRLAGAFAARAPDDPRPLTLIGVSDTRALQLSSRTVQGAAQTASQSATVALTPILGWAMLQSQVEVADWGAPFVMCCWLLTLYAPIGWWTRRALLGGRRAAWIPALTVVLLPAALSRLAAIAQPALLEWAIIFAALVVGAAASARRSAR